MLRNASRSTRGLPNVPTTRISSVCLPDDVHDRTYTIRRDRARRAAQVHRAHVRAVHVDARLAAGRAHRRHPGDLLPGDGDPGARAGGLRGDRAAAVERRRDASGPGAPVKHRRRRLLHRTQADRPRRCPRAHIARPIDRTHPEAVHLTGGERHGHARVDRLRERNGQPGGPEVPLELVAHYAAALVGGRSPADADGDRRRAEAPPRRRARGSGRARPAGTCRGGR